MDLLSRVDWPAFLLAMALIELTPGPNMGWLAALSAQHGYRAGLWAVAGITAGLALQVLAATVGLSALAGQSAWIYNVLRWSGVAYMVWLAWAAWAETAEDASGQLDEGSAFRRGFVANVLNPKALVFYVAVIGQFVAPAAGAIWAQILILGGIHVAIAAAVHGSIVYAGTGFGRSLKRWQNSVPVRAGFALALLAMAVWVAITTGR